jgi:hypothetical protein
VVDDAIVRDGIASIVIWINSASPADGNVRAQVPVGDRFAIKAGASVLGLGVRLSRRGGLLRLPLPAHAGSIDLLRLHVNLAEPDFRLMIAGLTAAMRPVGLYPIVVLNGENASGKSTLAGTLRLLIIRQSRL